jgi:hypothetical protein
MIVAGSGGIYTLNADGSNNTHIKLPLTAYSSPDWLPFIPSVPTARETVGAQIRARLERYVFPPGILALRSGDVGMDVRAAGGVLRASDLVRLGASLCMEIGGRSDRGVVGRDGRIVAGRDFAISEGVPYAVNADAPIQLTLAGDGPELSASAMSEDHWAFATVARVADFASVAPGARLRVTNERTGTVVVAEPSSGAFLALFASTDGDAVVDGGSAFTFQLVEAGGYALGAPVRHVASTADVELASTLVEIDARPDAVRALPNYPNPFNPETWMPFQLDARADVDIRIYDARGELVRLLELGPLDAGYYVSRNRAARWDGRNANGEIAAGGVYFTELRAGEQRILRRMMLRK